MMIFNQHLCCGMKIITEAVVVVVVVVVIIIIMEEVVVVGIGRIIMDMDRLDWVILDIECYSIA
jgi:hypothetical protein